MCNNSSILFLIFCSSIRNIHPCGIHLVNNLNKNFKLYLIEFVIIINLVANNIDYLLNNKKCSIGSQTKATNENSLPKNSDGNLELKFISFIKI